LIRACFMLAAMSLAALGGAAEASPGPQPVKPPPPVPAARDVPYPGTVRVAVDATDLDRRVFKVHETVPVEGGKPLTLLYPQWLPGNHSPSGPLANLAGLTVHAGGARVEWVRDTVDVYAFHLTAPAGATTLDLDFDFVSPVQANEGRVVMTPEMLSLQWSSMTLYPAGWFTRRIPVEAQVTLPAGWGFGTALETASKTGDTVAFKTVPYETLVDSPMLAGRYFKQVDLDPGGKVPVRLNIAGDTAGALEINPEAMAAHKALVQQAYRLYGSHHYDHYDFLLSVTDRLGGVGLEHHRSSEDGADADYFTDWDKTAPGRDLLAHEYTHSWNGKFRRPADLWTPDYDTPMQDSLLWVYEGQTQYWGYVLAARSGLLTKPLTLDAIALAAATYDHVPGRAWKALQDTTNDPIIAQRRSIPWRSYERSEDYYVEGQLIWLDVDTLIRERSGGKRSLDDFAKAFFGVDDGSFVPHVYTFQDVVTALNAVEPYDWASFLRQRLDGHGPGAPLDGLARGGYRLVYTDQRSDYQKQRDTMSKNQDFAYSLGFVVSRDDTLSSVLWDSPAFKAGITLGVKLIAVDGIAYDADRLRTTVNAAAKPGAKPIEILVKDGDHYRTVAVDYHGGLRYPHLEKTGAAPASLDDILTPKP
jgi:predicted metalloprotease with PDZ domain